MHAFWLVAGADGFSPLLPAPREGRRWRRQQPLTQLCTLLQGYLGQPRIEDAAVNGIRRQSRLLPSAEAPHGRRGLETKLGRQNPTPAIHTHLIRHEHGYVEPCMGLIGQPGSDGYGSSQVHDRREGPDPRRSDQARALVLRGMATPGMIIKFAR